MKQPLLIYGVGGSAREVAWLLDDSGQSDFSVVGFIDEINDRTGPWLDARPIYTLDEAQFHQPNALYALALGSPDAKRQVAAELMRRHLPTPAIIHPGCTISARNTISDGVIICAGCQITVDIRLGCFVHLNLNCTVSHDVTIGDFSTLSPGVHVAGAVNIGRNVFIGVGANIINGSAASPLQISDGCVIAAGACVISSTEPDTLYAGVPAVRKRHLSAGTPVHSANRPSSLKNTA
jgi:sugar O-acyltransferase (sialic acid O-acetyltransferase NeuD family)